MAIRQQLAKQLTKAAAALENDKSKEKVNAMIFSACIALANKIMPNIKPVKQ